MNDDMRKAFESLFSAKRHPRRTRRFESGPDAGEYVDPWLRMAWLTYQAGVIAGCQRMVADIGGAIRAGERVEKE